ncbi:MAG: RluA family pseudouridine synthase [Chromatiaceae bacterium]|nr:MAG: RluA family pseudouridine synthase [Chromatiaceae bacterium]
MRVDNFLVSYLKGVPKSLIYRILRRGEVRLNKARVKPAQRLTEGDQLRIPPLRRALPPAPLQPSAGLTARLAAAVLYEDERLLVLDKPAGLAVHGGSGVSLGLIEGLRALRPGSELELVHRLDRDTSGCLVISKRRSTLRWLHAQFRDGAIDKRYLLLLSGPLPQPALTVDAPLLKNLLRGGERMVSVDPAAGKSARTHFRRLRCLGDLTLAEARLETGRTHQIRVHAQHLGTPIAGDDKYGDAAFNARLRRVGLKRLFLHASALSFRPHAEADAVHIEAPLPAALAQVLARLEELPWTTS